ncbi:signal peptidase I [Patescibacteria group bacterium]
MKVKKVFSFIIGAFSWILIGSFVIAMGMTLLSNFNLLQGYRSFLVQSGSMEPSIMMGDVVITTKASQYRQNDVVTFLDQGGRTVTHRVLEIQNTDRGSKLLTKGDANQSKDRDEITPNQVLGKVSLVIPKMGFIIAFSRTPIGLLILVVIPAGIIAFDEIKNLFKETGKKSKEEGNTAEDKKVSNSE